MALISCLGIQCLQMLHFLPRFWGAAGKLMLETRSLKGPPTPAITQLFTLYKNSTGAASEITMCQSILGLFRFIISQRSLQSWKEITISKSLHPFLALLQLYEIYYYFIYRQCTHSLVFGDDKSSSKLPPCNMMNYLLCFKLPVQRWILNVSGQDGRWWVMEKNLYSIHF